MIVLRSKYFNFGGGDDKKNTTFKEKVADSGYNLLSGVSDVQSRVEGNLKKEYDRNAEKERQNPNFIKEAVDNTMDFGKSIIKYVASSVKDRIKERRDKKANLHQSSAPSTKPVTTNNKGVNYNFKNRIGLPAY